jgi:hypothetical protein
MLHNVHAALVNVHGLSTTARTDPTGSEGNVVFLHLFIDALALQPCQPDCEFGLQGAPQRLIGFPLSPSSADCHYSSGSEQIRGRE